jgi:hypothetical protein
VKPNGLLGTGYMAAIKPFRHLIVYPAMMREIGRSWRAPGGARVAQMVDPNLGSRIPDPRTTDEARVRRSGTQKRR